MTFGFCCSDEKKNFPFKLCSPRLVEASLKNSRKLESEYFALFKYPNANFH